jgi:hypothetical protein
MAPFLARTARTLFRGTATSADKIQTDNNDDDDGGVPHFHKAEEPQHGSSSKLRATMPASLVASSDQTWSTALEESAEEVGVVAELPAGLTPPDDDTFGSGKEGLRREPTPSPTTSPRSGKNRKALERPGKAAAVAAAAARVACRRR